MNCNFCSGTCIKKGLIAKLEQKSIDKFGDDDIIFFRQFTDMVKLVDEGFEFNLLVQY